MRPAYCGSGRKLGYFIGRGKSRSHIQATIFGFGRRYHCVIYGAGGVMTSLLPVKPCALAQGPFQNAMVLWFYGAGYVVGFSLFGLLSSTSSSMTTKLVFTYGGGGVSRDISGGALATLLWRRLVARRFWARRVAVALTASADCGGCSLCAWHTGMSAPWLLVALRPGACATITRADESCAGSSV